MQFQVHKKVRSQKKKDFWNINFLLLHVCLGLNNPRNQPGPDRGRERDAREQ